MAAPSDEVRAMPTQTSELPRLLRRPEVQRMTGLSKTTLYSLMQAGEFPRPVKLAERCAAWPEAEVSQWIERRIAESRRAAA
jgi:prophage regulatory protein